MVKNEEIYQVLQNPDTMVINNAATITKTFGKRDELREILKDPSLYPNEE